MSSQSPTFSLRPDLLILPGPPEDDGSPTAIVQDPLTEAFSQVGWEALEVLRRLRRPVDAETLFTELRQRTTIRATREEVEGFLLGLHRRGLLRSSLFQDPQRLEQLAQLHDRQLRRRITASYLFFRIPLLRPDAWLRRNVWLPRLLGSRPFGLLYLLVAVAAVVLFLPRMDVFLRSVAPFLAWSGAVWLSLALIGVKACHEFSHAFAAAARGVTVRSMGLAFMVLAPIPYTDVTDSWRLTRRRRLAVSSAGVRTELVIAAFALLLWSLSPPGVGRDICLFLASASLLSTLFTNLNPGMRFDGYYMMSDLIGIDNLQERAFAHARRFYRRALLGLPTEGGEPRLGAGKRAALVAYSLYATVYRLGLYFGIALLVYNYFPKVLGVLLFAVEIYAFILAPIMRELAAVAGIIYRKRTIPMRLVLMLALLAGVAYWFAAPFPRRVALEAVVTSPEEVVVYAPNSGLVVRNGLQRGVVLGASEVVLELENRELDLAIRQAELEVEGAGLGLDYSLSGSGGRGELRGRVADEGRLESTLSALRARKSLNRLRAGREYVVLDAVDDVPPGSWVARRTYLGRLSEAGAARRLAAYLPEGEANGVRVGGEGVFRPACAPGREIGVRIARVLSTRAEQVEEAELLAPHGGGVAVVWDRVRGAIPAETLYKVEAEFTEAADADADLRLGQTGRLYVYGPPKSLARDLVDWLYRVALRESGF